MKRRKNKPTAEQIELLKKTGSGNKEESKQAMAELATALQIPLRSALLNGDITSNIYDTEVLTEGATPEYPIDIITGDNVDDYIAYTIPSEGAIPTRAISGDVITLQTFPIANAIDWQLRFAREARWPVIARAMEVMEAGFVKKINTDGWSTIIGAGTGRTDFSGGAPMVFDSAATAGQFTKRLVSLMKTSMTRLSGGNSATQNRGQLTDLYISPEALEDIRDWDATEVDDLTRRDIFLANDNTGNGTTTGPLATIFGVTLHSITELGESQEYQNLFNALSVSMGSGDLEIVIGLDLQQNDSFVMPIRQELSVFEDDALHRRQRAGFYGWQEHGFGVLDARRVLMGSF